MRLGRPPGREFEAIPVAAALELLPDRAGLDRALAMWNESETKQLEASRHATPVAAPRLFIQVALVQQHTRRHDGHDFDGIGAQPVENAIPLVDELS